MFDPVRICEILNDEDVDYVIVGGFASVVHGSPLPTQDIDVVPSRRADNLERLARALRRMNAMIRTDREPVPAPIDGPFLEAMPLMLNLVTDFGDLNLTFTPSGGYIGGDCCARRHHRVQARSEPTQGPDGFALPRVAQRSDREPLTDSQTSARSRASARVFQPSTAHLIRTGNFTTPCSASRSPMGTASSPGCAS